MNAFDTSIVTEINKLAQLSWTFDSTIYFLTTNNLFKGGILVSAIWWGWFKKSGNQLINRGHIITTLLSCIIAIAIGRLFALTLPFRLRPLHNETLGLLLPYRVESNAMQGWSSFPSDHAVLFFFLSAGLFFISRKAGILALAYTTVIICFSRIYTGFHYPTDIIAGAGIGICLGWLVNTHFTGGKITGSVLRWSETRPETFYPAFFLLSYQVATLFDDSRAMIKFVYTTLRAILPDL